MGADKSSQLFGITSTGTGNNFSRPEGQNVGNFLGDRPSSRVLAAPGGKSNFSFGNTDMAPQAAPAFHGKQADAVHGLEAAEEESKPPQIEV